MSHRKGKHHPSKTFDESAFGRFPLPKHKWTPSKNVTKCMSCNKAFSKTLFKTGKHHCRKCGDVVCSKCFVHELDGFPVCTPCFKQENNKNSKLKPHYSTSNLLNIPHSPHDDLRATVSNPPSQLPSQLPSKLPSKLPAKQPLSKPPPKPNSKTKNDDNDKSEDLENDKTKSNSNGTMHEILIKTDAMPELTSLKENDLESTSESENGINQMKDEMNGQMNEEMNGTEMNDEINEIDSDSDSSNVSESTSNSDESGARLILGYHSGNDNNEHSKYDEYNEDDSGSDHDELVMTPITPAAPIDDPGIRFGAPPSESSLHNDSTPFVLNGSILSSMVPKPTSVSNTNNTNNTNNSNANGVFFTNVSTDPNARDDSHRDDSHHDAHHMTEESENDNKSDVLTPFRFGFGINNVDNAVNTVNTGSSVNTPNHVIDSNRPNVYVNNVGNGSDDELRMNLQFDSRGNTPFASQKSKHVSGFLSHLDQSGKDDQRLALFFGSNNELNTQHVSNVVDLLSQNVEKLSNYVEKIDLSQCDKNESKIFGKIANREKKIKNICNNILNVAISKNKSLENEISLLKENENEYDEKYKELQREYDNAISQLTKCQEKMYEYEEYNADMFGIIESNLNCNNTNVDLNKAISLCKHQEKIFKYEMISFLDKKSDATLIMQKFLDFEKLFDKLLTPSMECSNNANDINSIKDSTNGSTNGKSNDTNDGSTSDKVNSLVSMNEIDLKEKENENENESENEKEKERKGKERERHMESKIEIENENENENGNIKTIVISNGTRKDGVGLFVYERMLYLKKEISSMRDWINNRKLDMRSINIDFKHSFFQMEKELIRMKEMQEEFDYNQMKFIKKLEKDKEYFAQRESNLNKKELDIENRILNIEKRETRLTQLETNLQNEKNDLNKLQREFEISQTQWNEEKLEYQLSNAMKLSKEKSEIEKLKIELLNKKETLNNENKKLQLQKELLTKEKEMLQQSQQQLYFESKNLNKQFEILDHDSNYAKNLEQQYTHDKTRHINEMNELKNKINNLEIEIQKLNIDNNGLANEITLKEKNYQSLLTKYETLSNDYNNLKQESKNYEKNVFNMNMQLEKQKQEISKNESMINESNNEMKKMEEENNDQISLINDEKLKLMNENNQLNDEMNQLKEKINELRQENKEMKIEFKKHEPKTSNKSVKRLNGSASGSRRGSLRGSGRGSGRGSARGSLHSRSKSMRNGALLSADRASKSVRNVANSRVQPKLTKK